MEPPLRQALESRYGRMGGAPEFEYLEPATYVLTECLTCDLLFQKHVPNDALTRRIWERWLDPEGPFAAFVTQRRLDSYAGYAQEVMTVLAYFDASPKRRRPLRFFDFGMGWGLWCRMARAFGVDAYGSEILESRIAYARAQGVTVISWEEIPSHAFDVINADNVFEHLVQPLATLSYLRAALAPGGLMKIGVPDGRDIRRRLRIMDWTAPHGSRNALMEVFPLIHINCYTHRTLVHMARLAGLEPVKIPLRLQYAYSTNWKPISPLLRRLVTPLYRNLLSRGTYLYFRSRDHASPSPAA